MTEDLTYITGAEDENGDHHMFLSEDRDRAIAAYRRFVERYGIARTNDGLAAALREAGFNL